MEFQFAEKEKPHCAECKYLCASTAELNGDDEKAQQLAEQAMNMDAGNGQVYLLLGRLMIKQKNYQNAMNVLRAARAFRDYEIEALKLELELWLETEEWAHALSVLELLSQKDYRRNWDGMLMSVLELSRD